MRTNFFKGWAIGSLMIGSCIASDAALTTNSWIANANGKWETSANWSFGTPSSSQSAIIMTNGSTNPTSTRSVTIDQTTVAMAPGSLTISNLWFQGNGTLPVSGIFNGLIMTNSSANPADVTLTVVGTPSVDAQINIDHRGYINVSNATLAVVNGQIFDNGSLQLTSGNLTLSNTYVYIGADINNDVGISGTMTVLGGTWISNTAVGVGGSGQGTLTIAGGTCLLSEALYVTAASGGSVFLTGGQLTITNDITKIGVGSVGQMTVGGGTWQAGDVILGEGGSGILTITGGVSTLQSLGVGELGGASPGTGAVWMTGGQLTVTNGSTSIPSVGIGQMTVSNGTWLASVVSVAGHDDALGALTIAGGTSCISTSLTFGDTECDSTPIGLVSGGSLFVTNGAHTAMLEIEGGTLTQSGGTLTVDQLVMANTCAQFIQTGGAFIITGPSRFDQGDSVLSGAVVVVTNLLVASSAGLTGTVEIVGGSLIASNAVIGIGNNGTTTGSGGVGAMTISNAVVSVGSLLLGSTSGGQGTVILRPGASFVVVNKLAGNDVLLEDGTIDGTSATLSIGENHPASMTVSNGAAVFNTAYIGFNNTGSLTMPGGVMTVLSNMVVGDCGASVTGLVTISGGALFVTNAAHNAVLDVRSGQFIMTGGAVVADRIVMTNACAVFLREAGTTSFGSMTLDPTLSADGDGIPNGWKQQYGLDPFDLNLGSEDPDGDGLDNYYEYVLGTDPTDPHAPFAITAITRETSNIRVTWQYVPPPYCTFSNYVVEASAAVTGTWNAVTGTMSIPPGPLAILTSDYLDVGGATNGPSRFYRVRLVP
ncbi:MAG TPA: hypothetical protein VMP11_09960 [Verrucomicrobiae bacterium]|nr:hypothetical protein [Verrucomicrobiae bacterium]